MIKCYECDGPHYKSKCPNLKRGNNNNVALFSAFIARKSSSEWFIDSGATAHMTCSKSILTNTTNSERREVTIADNNKLIVDCVGNVNQKIKTNGEICDITLTDVQCVPGICVNLLSVSKMVQDGKEVLFTKTGCTIFDEKQKIVATDSLVDNMFKLNTVSNEFACAANSNKNDIVLWHRRLAHASWPKVNFLLNIKSKTKIQCITCVKGKQAKKPFNNVGERANGLLDLIHSDVCGPMQVNSIGGSKYFVTFIDDYSRKVFIYAMKQKSEVFAKFDMFKNLVENQLNKKIKVLRTDNGTEYLNKNFKMCQSTNGFRHEKSAPYSHDC